MRLPIESKMEIFARTYSKDTGVNIKVGSNFATDGKTIFIVPITDRADNWIRFETEMGVYHETGHIKTKDFPTFKKIQNKTKKSLFNIVRDVCIEKKMETIYPGMKPKWIKFLSKYIELKTNSNMSNPLVTTFQKLTWVLYLRAREKQLGIDLGLVVPDEIEEIFKARLAPFVEAVASHKTIAESSALAEEIYEVLKMEEPEEKPQPQSGGKGNPNESEGNEPEESEGSGDPQDSDDGDENESGSSDDKDEDSSDKNEDEDKESGSSGEDSSDKNDEDSDGSGSGDKESPDKPSSDKSKDGDGSGSGDEESSDKSKDGDDKEPAEPKLSDEAKEALKEAQKEMEGGTEGADIGKDIAEDINEYADTNIVYRDATGLVDRVIEANPRFGWETEVNDYEDEGRRITGYSGTKLKILFISEKAPVWHRFLRTGKLDCKNLWKLKQGRDDVCKRKTPSVLEDAAVSLVIDNSSSMNLQLKSRIAQSLLTALSSDLDKLRIPFEAVGFTNNWSIDPRNADGVRTMPSTLNLMKSFDTPYRTIRHRFVWPSVNNFTAELPAIVFAAKRLAIRRETKKVLFILTDGMTVTGDDTLNKAMHKATGEYISRLKRAGIKVVLIGIQDKTVLDYDPNAIIIKDLGLFAIEFYGKLMKILL